MNSGALKVATIGGIAIKLHWSWLIIALLVTIPLATARFPESVPGETAAFYWLTGAIASFLFFFSVLLHELSHSFTARALGYKVREIILFVFGGVANIEQEPKRARDEFLIAVVGPLASLLLAGIFYGLQLITRPGEGVESGASAIFDYLAFVNLLLALFNMIPGFPLDGGRVLRSIIWGISRNFGSATRIAGLVGQVFAYFFIGWGIFQIFYQNNFSGLWLAFIGWFLLNAAQDSVRSVVMRETIRGVYVRNLMEPPPPTIRPTSTLAHLLSSSILPYNLSSVPVTDPDGRLVGIVSLSDIKEVPQDQWGIATVGEYMIGVDKLPAVFPHESLDRAISLLNDGTFDQLPVIDQYGRLIGMLSRARIVYWLQRKDAPSQQPS